MLHDGSACSQLLGLFFMGAAWTLHGAAWALLLLARVCLRVCLLLVPGACAKPTSRE